RARRVRQRRPQSGENSGSTCVPRTGVFSSFKLSVSANAAAVPVSRPSTSTDERMRATARAILSGEGGSAPPSPLELELRADVQDELLRRRHVQAVGHGDRDRELARDARRADERAGAAVE